MNPFQVRQALQLQVAESAADEINYFSKEISRLTILRKKISI